MIPTKRAICQQLIDRLKHVSDAPSSRLYSKVKPVGVADPRSGPRAAAFAPGAPAEWEGWDDAALLRKAGAYMRDIRKLMNEYHYRGAFYGHFGQGCVHMRVSSISKVKKGSGNTQSSSNVQPIWWSDMVVHFPGEQGAGNQELSASENVGPELVRPLANSRRLGSR